MKLLSLLVFMLTAFYVESTVDKASEETRFALRVAVQHGNVCQVKDLLRSDASGHLSETDVRTALVVAANNGYFELFKLLLDSKASEEFLKNHSQAVILRAADEGHVEVVRYLIERQVDSDSVEKLGRVALMSAARKGHVEVIHYLIELQVDLNVVDKYGRTALMEAASEGHVEVVQCLIEREVDLNVADNYGRTAIMKAASGGHSKIVGLLFEYGAELNAVDRNQETSLMLAVSNGCLEVVKALIECGADVNAYSKDLKSALIIAATKGYLKIVKVLLHNGAAVNAVDIDQRTALILAAHSGHLAVVQFLVLKGAELDAVDVLGYSALANAILLEKWKVSEFLIKFGAKLPRFSISCDYHMLSTSNEKWDLKDLEFEYQRILSEVDSEKKEQQLNRLWTKVESWITLGANASEVIHEVREETLPEHNSIGNVCGNALKSVSTRVNLFLFSQQEDATELFQEENVVRNYPRLILQDGIFQSFLFTYFEFFQGNNGFFETLFDLGNESWFVPLTVEELASLFRIQFGRRSMKDIVSVNDFLALNRRVIRFACFFPEEDLLNNIVEQVASFPVADFDSFWNQLKIVFAEFDQHENAEFRKFCSKLLLVAANRSNSTNMPFIARRYFKNLACKIANDNIDFDFDAFLSQNILSEDSIQVILSQWIQ